MNALLADIATGNTGFADVMFLIAVVLAGLAVLAHYVKAGADSASSASRHAAPLLAAAVAALALGWLVL